MNCVQCKKLFDAYLDGQLAGSLRLEFDAHRLRCRHCQQTLAMLEAVGHVIASDGDVPALSDGFTARVMRDVQRPRTLRFPAARVALVAGALLQAAAVLVFAIVLNTRPAAPPVEAVASAGRAGVGSSASPVDKPGAAFVRALIADAFQDRVSAMHAAGQQLTADVVNLAKYLDMPLPDDVARASVKMASGNPWQDLWDSVAPAEREDPDSGAGDDDVQSL
jgi:anti-sigma factor RsiW